MSVTYLKHSLQRVSTFLNVEKSNQIPNPVLLQSSCFIVPTSIHVNTSIQFHFIMPAHMVNPFHFQHFLIQNDAQLRYFDKIRNNPDIDLKRDLRASVHILGDEWIDPSTGKIASIGRKSFWDNHFEEVRNEYQANFKDDEVKVGNALAKTLQIQDIEHPTYNYELDLDNAFFHTDYNLAVVHAKSEPSPLILPRERVVTQWCDRDLEPDDVVYYTGWQIEDLGTFTSEYIAPHTWKGRLRQVSGKRCISEPFPASNSGKFHEGMIGGAIFADRGCIGMIEGVLAPKQSTAEKLGFDIPKINGVTHITHEMLENFILEVVEPQMEDRYGSNSRYDLDHDVNSTLLMDMERDWRNEL